MSSTAPPALPLPPVAETHTLLRKQLTYSGLATTYIISVLAASLAEIGLFLITILIIPKKLCLMYHLLYLNFCVMYF